MSKLQPGIYPCPSCEEGKVSRGRPPYQVVDYCERCNGSGFLHPDPDEEFSITRGELARIQAPILKAAQSIGEISELPDYSGLDKQWKRALEIAEEAQRLLQGANAEIDSVVKECTR